MGKQELKDKIKKLYETQGSQSVSGNEDILNEIVDMLPEAATAIRLREASWYANLPKTIKADNISYYFQDGNSTAHPTWVDSIFKDVIMGKKWVAILSHEDSGEDQILKMAYDFALEQLTVSLPSNPLFGSHAGLKFWLQGTDIVLSWADA